MTLKELKEFIHNELKSLVEVSEVDAFLYRLVRFRLNLERIDFIMKPNYELNQEDEDFFKESIEKLKEEIPIQYILGETEFYGMTFKVSPATLIPRPETEELVDWIVQDVKVTANIASIEILDIGTGTGCIPISLAKHIEQANVSAVDVSTAALSVAKENAENNKVAVQFLEQNILELHSNSKVVVNGPYDIIVSNPPYVRHLEKEEIKNNVLDHEPHLALFVEDDDALLFYKAITQFALSSLKENGVLYFEINQYLGKETVDLIKSLGFKTVELKKDLFGNNRMIKAQRK